ncbi:MAG: methyltransferase domain-containing protein [Rhodobacterales bacterium]|nr:methyltransferase domain-containing protein [Rhodobacterales bacterium]
MVTKDPGQQLLENAYRLDTPADNSAYYDSFASTYDTDFVERLGYYYPKAIAETFRNGLQETPVADIGCGTGAVANALSLSAGQIDGMDISTEMLAVAAGKALYRKLYEIDLTGPLESIPHDYGTVLSAGTFTHGHLGPGPLRGLLDIARPGGLFIIGVNQAHYTNHDFTATLDALTAERRIGAVTITTTRIYDKDGHDHSKDRALILQYRKL